MEALKGFMGGTTLKDHPAWFLALRQRNVRGFFPEDEFVSFSGSPRTETPQSAAFISYRAGQHAPEVEKVTE